jgi:hypothetical protein
MGHLPGLRGTSAVPGPACGRRGGYGQPQRPQGERGAGTDPSRGSRTAVPAAVFSRPESQRTGLGETQTVLTFA